MLTGIHHLALTVTDVERSSAWYSELLGTVHVIGDDTDDVRFRVLAHPDSGMVIGLRQYPMAGSGDVFDESQPTLTRSVGEEHPTCSSALGQPMPAAEIYEKAKSDSRNFIL